MILEGSYRLARYGGADEPHVNVCKNRWITRLCVQPGFVTGYNPRERVGTVEELL